MKKKVVLFVVLVALVAVGVFAQQTSDRNSEHKITAVITRASSTDRYGVITITNDSNVSKTVVLEYTTTLQMSRNLVSVPHNTSHIPVAPGETYLCRVEIGTSKLTNIRIIYVYNTN